MSCRRRALLPLREEDYLTEVHHVTGEGEDAGVVYSEMQVRFVGEATRPIFMDKSSLAFNQTTPFYQKGTNFELLHYVTVKKITCQRYVKSACFDVPTRFFLSRLLASARASRTTPTTCSTSACRTGSTRATAATRCRPAATSATSGRGPASRRQEDLMGSVEKKNLLKSNHF